MVSFSFADLCNNFSQWAGIPPEYPCGSSHWQYALFQSRHIWTGYFTLTMVILLKSTFFIYPCLTLEDLILKPQSVPLKWISLIVIFSIPPETSLPIVIPNPLLMVQSLMRMSFDGLPTLNPSWSLPDLIQILSSLQSVTHFSMITLQLESISIPSVLGLLELPDII